ncbi:glutaredoxin family protein [Rhodococcus sp. NPDC060086]|uniref:glutaredoxin family protein n=1 Tax=Rhodococcus sp. NPDC060086 TaxID=3347055 RepID=UPI00365274AD
MWRTWVPSLAIAAVAVLVVATGALDPASIAIAVVLFVLAWIGSPLLFPRHVDDATARLEAAGTNTPVVYWRPGCMFCMRLRASLFRRADRAIWVNIWRDPAAAARVREVNDGNETVPTVFLGERAHTNPDPEWMRAQLR